MEGLKVIYLSLKPETPNRGFWDYGLLDELFTGSNPIESNHIEPDDFAIVVIPARHHADKITQINQQLNHLKGVVLFLMGDEEHVFPVELINHPNIKIWVQNPEMGRHNIYGKLGCGFPGHIRKYMPPFKPKTKDFFFSGQITHSRREEMVREMEGVEGGEINGTKGFTQGYEPEEYYKRMAESKVILCPSGPVTVDTFRMFEAFELGCIPIADQKTPTKDMEGFFHWLFEEVNIRFPIVEYWGEAIYNIKSMAKGDWNRYIHQWWVEKKQEIKDSIIRDCELVGAKLKKEDITIIIPVSPIKSHPSIEVLQKTIESVRFHHPTAKIIVTFDGVREEQEDMREAYNEHIEHFLYDCWKWGDIKIFTFAELKHQVKMARIALEHVTTPLILYVEQDTPLVTDEPIEWDKITDFVKSDTSNMVRFHFEAQVPKAHDHLMIGEVEDGFLKTIQWSQRPHLAKTSYYRKILDENFSNFATCFIEDKMHGVIQDAYGLRGYDGWNEHKIHIYHPNDKNIKRSYTTDGRAGGKKYDEKQQF